MKSYSLILPLLFILASCDAPQRTLSPAKYTDSYGDGSGAGNFNNGGSGGGDTGSNNGGTTGGSGSMTGFENCNLNSTNGHTVDIGHFTICQSTIDETVFKFKPTLESSQYRVCLIPTYRDTSGSMPLGSPQCMTTVANQVYTGRLYKDRPGVSNRPINGVIVMKQPLTTSYYGCMYGYINWPGNSCTMKGNSYCSYWAQACPQGPGGTGICHTEPLNFMNQVCTAFKNTYGNAYADMATR